MADLLTSAKEWWLRNVTAPQANDRPEASNQLFQHRQTGVPGVVREIEPGIVGRQVDGDPSDLVEATLNHGPATDSDTARALAAVKQDWASRHRNRPDEGYIMIDPRWSRESGALAHEATHSLYQQMGITPEQNRALGDKAAFEASNARDFPSLKATEAAAYGVQAPTAGDTAEEAFMRDLIGLGRRNGRGDAAGKLERMYGSRKRDILTRQ